jgi:hypothetical protein
MEMQAVFFDHGSMVSSFDAVVPVRCRCRCTGAVGEQLQEAKMINKSLTTLNLVGGQPYPYLPVVHR